MERSENSLLSQLLKKSRVNETTKKERFTTSYNSSYVRGAETKKALRAKAPLFLDL